MTENDDDHIRERAAPESDGAPPPRRAFQPDPEPARLVPLLVELEADYVGVVWVRASRSELVTGTIFNAHGRRWRITGLSPSGVTYRCREVKDE